MRNTMSTTSTPSPMNINASESDAIRILVLDNIAQEGLALLDAAEGIEYEIQTGLSGEALRTALRYTNADGEKLKDVTKGIQQEVQRG